MGLDIFLDLMVYLIQRHILCNYIQYIILNAHVEGKVDFQRRIGWPVAHCQYIHCQVNVSG